MPISVATPPSHRGLAAPLRTLVRGTLAQEGLRTGEIGVVLADDALLRDLNRDYRGMDRATDVLSFAYDEAGEGLALGPREAGALVNGDLVVSMDRVREQARRFRVSEGRELARLVIHGALHLAGLDHQHDAERQHMRAREDHALAAARAPVAELEQALAALAAAPAPLARPKPARRAAPAAKPARKAAPAAKPRATARRKRA